MIKRMVLMLIVAALVFGGFYKFKSFQGEMIKKYMSSMGAPAQAVSTIKAPLQEWQAQFEAVGSLRAARGVDLSSEVSGIVETINFNSGDDVKEGALLVQLRAKDDIAKLKALQAAANLAKITYERDSKQFKAQAISRETLDTVAANLQNTEAQVAEQQAVVDKKSIRAPFSGHSGIRTVDLGQYINPGTPIVTLQDLDQIYIDFFLPQQKLSEIKIGQKVTVKNDTWPEQSFIGEISVINPKVDASTRNVQVRAVIANANHLLLLLPGMYVTVDIDTGAPQKYITLPQTAITYNPYGSTVYLVEGLVEGAAPKLTAKQTFVTTGDTRGDQVAILKGVKEGDVVVTTGQLKLRNGSPLIINNSILPSNDANPAPPEQ